MPFPCSAWQRWHLRRFVPCVPSLSLLLQSPPCHPLCVPPVPCVVSCEHPELSAPTQELTPGAGHERWHPLSLAHLVSPPLSQHMSSVSRLGSLCGIPTFVPKATHVSGTESHLCAQLSPPACPPWCHPAQHRGPQGCAQERAGGTSWWVTLPQGPSGVTRVWQDRTWGKMVTVSQRLVAGAEQQDPWGQGRPCRGSPLWALSPRWPLPALIGVLCFCCPPQMFPSSPPHTFTPLQPLRRALPSPSLMLPWPPLHPSLQLPSKVP